MYGLVYWLRFFISSMHSIRAEVFFEIFPWVSLGRNTWNAYLRCTLHKAWNDSDVSTNISNQNSSVEHMLNPSLWNSFTCFKKCKKVMHSLPILCKMICDKKEEEEEEEDSSTPSKRQMTDKRTETSTTPMRQTIEMNSSRIFAQTNAWFQVTFQD